MYYIDVTDTFGGELNYSWLHRYKTNARDARHALRKARKTLGIKARSKVVRDTGEIDALIAFPAGSCVAIDVRWDADDGTHPEDREIID